MEQSSNNITIVSFFKKPKEKKPSIFVEIIETELRDTNDDYAIIREPYKTYEFIPIQFISQIVKHHFNSAELLHSFAQNHLVFKIQIKDILGGPINNWEYNRPPDMSRCPDIARYIYNSRKPIDTMIYLTYKNIPDCFEVLDGIHRITALKIIKTENEKIKLIDNDANWLYDQYLLVNIRFNAVLGDLFEIFKTLNKSQTVPDIYIRDVAKEKRDIIDTIANDWQIRFKKHFSSSANPIIGNTNRNKFVDLLDKVYDKYKIDETKIGQFKQFLENANTLISFNVPPKTSLDSRVKCRETGCYLFLHKNDKLEELI